MQQSFYLQYTFLHKQLGSEMVYHTMVLVWYCGESFVTSAMSLSLQILSESFHRLSFLPIHLIKSMHILVSHYTWLEPHIT